MNQDRVRALVAQLAAEMIDAPLGQVTRAGENLLSRLEQAAPGSLFQVDPGVIAEAGTITLSKPVTLVSTVALSPVRVTPALIGPILRGAITITAPGVQLTGFRLEGPGQEATNLTTSHGTALDRCLVLGSAAGGHRGLRCDDSVGVRVKQCHIGNLWHTIDTQAISADSGCSDLLVTDSFLEASGENVIFGGSDTKTIEAMPHGITFEDCSFSKPLAWKDKAAVTVKNLFELKCAWNVRVRRCTFENSWRSGQDGFALVLTVRNQDGGSPWSTISDVVIEDCQFRHMSAGINILGRDYTHPSAVMTDVTIQRCTFEDIDPAKYGGVGRQTMIAGGPKNLHLLGNTFAGENLNSALTFDQPQFPLTGFQAIGNRWQEGAYGITAGGMGSDAIAILARYAPGMTWSANTIVRQAGNTYRYPAGTILG